MNEALPVLGQDLSGMKFGRLTCVSFNHRKGFGGNRYIYKWNCICDCGKPKIAISTSLRSGKTHSCGCTRTWRHLSPEDIKARNIVSLSLKEKSCACCKKIKPTEMFYVCRKKKTGRLNYSTQCKECLNGKGKIYVLKNKPVRYRANRKWYYKKYYGMTPEEVLAKKQAADFKCEICQKKKKIIHIDHCHATGLIRGLLCFKCNGAIGKFEDDPSLIQMAMNYLIKYNAISKSIPSSQHILRPLL
jgi:hypothetical protein